MDQIFDVTYPETSPSTAKKYNDYVFKLSERGLNGHIKPHKCILKEMQPIGNNITIGNSIVWK